MLKCSATQRWNQSLRPSPAPGETIANSRIATGSLPTKRTKTTN